MTHKDIIFKMEHQFTLYLQRCGVTRADLPPDQYREMRRAFYGGLGQMFFLVTDDVVKLQGKTYVFALTSMRDQIQEFWDRETEAQAKGLQEYAEQMPVACDCGWSGIVSELVKPQKGGPDDLCRCPKCNNPQLKVPK